MENTGFITVQIPKENILFSDKVKNDFFHESSNENAAFSQELEEFLVDYFNHTVIEII